MARSAFVTAISVNLPANTQSPPASIGSLLLTLVMEQEGAASVASESALEQLARHRALAREGLRVLIEVNVAGEPGKGGIAPAQLDDFIARSPLPVAGLMTMPPMSRDPGASRPWFAALRGLAEQHGLEHLSMGTSQDYVVAVEEGATIVRIGTKLYT